MKSIADCAREKSQSFCGILKKLLAEEGECLNNTVVIKGLFKETTRDGQNTLNFVQLALTAKAFVIATEKKPTSVILQPCLASNENKQKFVFYPWTAVKLHIFKRSRRQCIKCLFSDKSSRYFEILESPKIKIFWQLWCRYIEELNHPKKTWPFILTNSSNKNVNQKLWRTDCFQICIEKHQKKKSPPPTWTDKDLYLGTAREVEDKIRPRPVPGLGKTEEIKLFYLKPRYFGCWEQSEHWVQCGDSTPEFTN